MKKNIFYILIILTLIGFFSPIASIYAVPQSGPCQENYAQDPNGTGCVPIAGISTDKNYVLLAPLPCQNGDPGCTQDANGNWKLTAFDPSSTSGDKISGYLNLMIKIFIGLCAVLAVVMIVIGGIQYMTTELISSKEAGKERIRGAIFGLLLALGAWTLLNQINPNILNTDLNSLQNVTVEVTIDNTPQTPVNGKYTNSNLTYATGENWAPRAGILANLADSGATVYNAQCTTVGQKNCTSTAGLDPKYLNTIHQNCSTCTLSIQGGTEFWAHGGATGSTSHVIGSPTVDLGVNDALNKYILSGTPQGNGRYLKDGISYLDERKSTNHWHAGP